MLHLPDLVLVLFFLKQINKIIGLYTFTKLPDNIILNEDDPSHCTKQPSNRGYLSQCTSESTKQYHAKNKFVTSGNLKL